MCSVKTGKKISFYSKGLYTVDTDFSEFVSTMCLQTEG